MVNFKENYHFSKFPGGVHNFPGGGGSNCLFPKETHIICDFPGGGGSDPLSTPPPPPPLWIRYWFHTCFSWCLLPKLHKMVSFHQTKQPPELLIRNILEKYMSHWSKFKIVWQIVPLPLVAAHYATTSNHSSLFHYITSQLAVPLPEYLVSQLIVTLPCVSHCTTILCHSLLYHYLLSQLIVPQPPTRDHCTSAMCHSSLYRYILSQLIVPLPCVTAHCTTSLCQRSLYHYLVS